MSDGSLTFQSLLELFKGIIRESLPPEYDFVFFVYRIPREGEPPSQSALGWTASDENIDRAFAVVQSWVHHAEDLVAKQRAKSQLAVDSMP